MVSNPVSHKAQCNVSLYSRSRFPGLGVQSSWSLRPTCSISLSPACRLGWWKGLGPNRSWLCRFTLLSVVFTFLPGVGVLFYSLLVVFRVICICWLLHWCVYGRKFLPCLPAPPSFPPSPHSYFLKCFYSKWILKFGRVFFFF